MKMKKVIILFHNLKIQTTILSKRKDNTLKFLKGTKNMKKEKEI